MFIYVLEVNAILKWNKKALHVTEQCDAAEHDVEYGQETWPSKRDVMSGTRNWNSYIVEFDYRQIISFLEPHLLQ